MTPELTTNKYPLITIIACLYIYINKKLSYEMHSIYRLLINLSAVFMVNFYILYCQQCITSDDNICQTLSDWKKFGREDFVKFAYLKKGYTMKKKLFYSVRDKIFTLLDFL